MLKFSFCEIQEPWVVSKEFVIYFDLVIYFPNSVESYGSWITQKLNFSMRFPLEFYGGFYWFKNPSGSFRCWFRCTKPFLIFLFSWGTFPSAKFTDILVNISLLAGPRRLKIFRIGLILKGESHDHESFPRFKNFTLSRSKVWILPITQPQITIWLVDGMLITTLARRTDTNSNLMVS